MTNLFGLIQMKTKVVQRKFKQANQTILSSAQLRNIETKKEYYRRKQLLKKKKLISALLVSTMVLSSMAIPATAVATATENSKEERISSTKGSIVDGLQSTNNYVSQKETRITKNLLENPTFNRQIGSEIEDWYFEYGNYNLTGVALKSIGALTSKTSFSLYWLESKNNSNISYSSPSIVMGIQGVSGTSGNQVIGSQTISTIPGRKYFYAMSWSQPTNALAAGIAMPSTSMPVYKGSATSGAGIITPVRSERIDTTVGGVKSYNQEVEFLASTDVSTITFRLSEAKSSTRFGMHFTDAKVYEYGNDVTVNYVDKNGVALANQETLTGFIGDTYATGEKTFIGYRLVEIKGNTEGTFTREDQPVTYVYERVAGAPITVNYKDTEGNLLDSATLTGFWGDAWTADSKVIDGYEVVQIPTKENGIFGDTPQTIEYIYKKLLPGEVMVEYVDEDGQDILDPQVLTGLNGTSYETTAPVVEGFELKITPANANGTFDQDTVQKVTYVYARLQGAPVTVTYVDEAGKEIATPDVLNGKFGTIFDTNPKAIPGYHLTKAPENESGEFTMSPQTVTYVYAAQTAGTITVNYVDQDGGLLDSATVTGKFNEAYTTEQKAFTGYEFTGLGQGSAPVSGTFTMSPQTVTYQYQAQEAAPVTVKYVDTVGNELGSDTLTGLFGTEYTTEAKEFSGYALKTTPNNANGTFSMDPQTVTYVYEAGRGATITVKYINQEGNEIAAAKTLNGKVGQSFTETAKMPSGYDLIGDSQRTFTITAEPQTVVFEYVGKNASKLTIQYVDEATGEQIAPATGFTGGKTGDAYSAEVKTIPGYTVVDASKATGFRPQSATTYQITYKKNDAISFDLNYVGVHQQKVIGFLPTGVTTSELSLYVKKAGDDEWKDSGYRGTADASTGYFAIESRLVKGGKGFLLENQDQVKVVFTGNDGESYEGVKVVQPYTAPVVDVYTAGTDSVTGTVPNGANYVRLAINNIPTRTVAITPTPGATLPGSIDAKTGNFTVYAKSYSDSGNVNNADNKIIDTAAGDTLTLDYGLQIYGAQNNPSTTIIAK